MFYRDRSDVRIAGIYSRTEDWTADRQIIAFADSMGDAERWLSDTPAKWEIKASTCMSAKRDWDLNVGYAGALTLARDGWNEGVEMIDTALQALVPASDHEGRWGWSQQGGTVSVTRYLSGHPKCMKNRRKKQSGSAPVFHIIVNVAAASVVRSQQMANYGAALTGLIDRLESTGRRVQLDCVTVANCNDIRVSVGWTVKRASEPVDLSQVAFSIGHPASLRRLHFAMMERCSNDAESAGYGYSADASFADVPDCTEATMVVDGVNAEPHRCLTPMDALRYAIEQLNKAAVIAGHATIDQPLIDEADWVE
jgi:hypothetical protein